jgi:peptide deformylase
LGLLAQGSTDAMVPTASSPYPVRLALVHYPHPVLRRRAQAVADFGPELTAFAERLVATMDDSRGIGLAAPQVGVSARIFVTDHGKRQEDARSDRRIWVNPRISDADGVSVHEEGCLSFPGIFAKVDRHARFTLHWQDLAGEHLHHRFDAEADFLGVVVQHELDHLDGRVFVDHLSEAQLLLARKRLHELEDEYKAATGKHGAVLRR